MRYTFLESCIKVFHFRWNIDNHDYLWWIYSSGRRNILMLVFWAIWFACVGIKLYKRHLCQKDDQFEKIVENKRQPCGMNLVLVQVNIHSTFYSPVFLLRIKVRFNMRLYYHLSKYFINIYDILDNFYNFINTSSLCIVRTYKQITAISWEILKSKSVIQLESVF